MSAVLSSKTLSVVDPQMVAALEHAVAATASEVRPLRRCGNGHWVDGVACSKLTRELYRRLPARLQVKCCEGRKDAAPMIAEGSVVGGGNGAPIGALVVDPIEVTSIFADSSNTTSRGSLVVVATAPLGAVPLPYSGCRALKLVAPPGLRPDPALLHRPRELAWQVCKEFGCGVPDIEVHILGGERRFWNRGYIAEFRAAGACVKEIPAGDFEAHIVAAQDRLHSKVCLSYGIGGVPEGILAVPYVLMTGASMLLELDPRRDHVDQITEAGGAHTLGRVYSASDLIRTANGECAVVWAGVTPSSIADGVRAGAHPHDVEVEVVSASPIMAGEQRRKVRVRSHVN